MTWTTPDQALVGWRKGRAEKVKLAPWTLHDLRRTVDTRMAGSGVPKEIVIRVLNHAAGPIYRSL